MADELTVRVGGTLRNGVLIADFPVEAIRVDQADDKISDRVLNIGTTHEAITFGDLATPGYLGLHNQDPSNFVQVGVDDAGVFVPVLKLLPLEIGLVPIDPAAALFARADIAPVDLRFWAVSR